MRRTRWRKVVNHLLFFSFLLDCSKQMLTYFLCNTSHNEEQTCCQWSVRRRRPNASHFPPVVCVFVTRRTVSSVPLLCFPHNHLKCRGRASIVHGPTGDPQSSPASPHTPYLLSLNTPPASFAWLLRLLNMYLFPQVHSWHNWLNKNLILKSGHTVKGLC